MNIAHSIRASVFSHEKDNEDSNAILAGLLDFFPFTLEKEKIIVSKSIAKGFNEKNITSFEVSLSKDRHIRLFLDSLVSRLDEAQKRKILSQAVTRLDNNLDFFLRFDKKTFIESKKLLLTDSGNCFHIRISVAAFPKKRETALLIVNRIFGK